MSLRSTSIQLASKISAVLHSRTPMSGLSPINHEFMNSNIVLTSGVITLDQVLLFKEAKELSDRKYREIITTTILLLNVHEFQLKNEISSSTHAAACSIVSE